MALLANLAMLWQLLAELSFAGCPGWSRCVPQTLGVTIKMQQRRRSVHIFRFTEPKC